MCHLEAPAAPAALPHDLLDVGGGHRVASGLRSTKCLPSKQTRGLDAGECREAVGACLLKHISCACSWRSRPARCPSVGDSVRPALAEHIGSDFSAARGSFSTKIQNDTQLVTRARWPWRSARATRAWAILMRSCKKNPREEPTPYSRVCHSCGLQALCSV